MGKIYGFPDPSKYHIHRMIYDIASSKELKEEFKSSPLSVMRRYGLSDKDIEVIMSADGSKMYQYGIHPYAIIEILIELKEAPPIFR
jgi:hypothetical protein